VKIKGYRIEPTGVAALLRQIEGVDEAVVVPRDAAFGAKQLVSFLRGDARLSEAELHHAAASLMPDYMLPGAFSWVDEFPLKANGKLDVPALLARLDAKAGAADEVQASDELERRLIEIWRRNGARASFDLDTPIEEVCDSLAVVGVTIDIEAAFGRLLPASALAPPVTIRSMATALRAPTTIRTDPVRAFYVGPPWLMHPLPRAIGCALDATGEYLEIRVHPAASAASAYGSVEAMGEILESQVLARGSGGPYTLAGFSLGGVLAFEVARRLERRGEQVERVVLLDSFLVRRRAPLDWAQVRLRMFLAKACEDPRATLARLARRGRVALGKETPNRADQIRDRCLRATFRYVPSQIAAPAVLVRSMRYATASDRPENNLFAATQAWEPHVGQLEVAELDCSHMQLVNDPGWITKVAEHLRASSGPEAQMQLRLASARPGSR
jgi:thioesterase domain-containing protein